MCNYDEYKHMCDGALCETLDYCGNSLFIGSNVRCTLWAVVSDFFFVHALLIHHSKV